MRWRRCETLTVGDQVKNLAQVKAGPRARARVCGSVEGHNGPSDAEAARSRDKPCVTKTLLERGNQCTSYQQSPSWPPR